MTNTVRLGRQGILNEEKVASPSTTAKEIYINSTSTECKAGTEYIKGRHQVMLKNFSSYYVYWSFDENMVYGEGQLIRSGDIDIIDVKPFSNTKIYAVAKIDEVPLFVTEVISWQ